MQISELKSEISIAEEQLKEPDGRAIRLWERIRIAPEQWLQKQYPRKDHFWVIAIFGRRCLYFNSVEGGWGWGQFKKWGVISEYHWNDLEIYHVVFQSLFAIDNGGLG